MLEASYVKSSPSAGVTSSPIRRDRENDETYWPVDERRRLQRAERDDWRRHVARRLGLWLGRRAGAGGAGLADPPRRCLTPNSPPKRGSGGFRSPSMRSPASRRRCLRCRIATASTSI